MAEDKDKEKDEKDKKGEEIIRRAGHSAAVRRAFQAKFGKPKKPGGKGS